MVTARELLSGFGGHLSGVESARGPLVRRLVVSSLEVDPHLARLSYWRNIRRVSVILLAAWLVVTLALPWFATELNLYRIGRFPLGFWLSSQGAVGIYVVLIVVYIWAVEMIEDAWHDAKEAASDAAASADGSIGSSAAAAGRRRNGD